MATYSLALSATRYKGTSVDTNLQYDTIGNPWVDGGAEYYRLRLDFVPPATFNVLTVNLSYSGQYNMDKIAYYCGVSSTVPSNNSTNGTAFSWVGNSATLTFYQTFAAQTTYSIWVWSPSSVGGYVNLSAYSASGEATTYTVTYNANGGTGAPSPQYKDYATYIYLSNTVPTKSPVTSVGNTVYFNANGGTTTKTSQTATDTIKYTFSKWNTAANGTGTSYASGAYYSADASVTLYAQYTSSTTKGAVTLPTAAQCTRAGYTLLGFATSATATTAAYAPGSSYTASSETTLYAVWSADGLVYIDNSASLEPYQVFIDNGTAWEQYAPFADNGTAWEAIS